MKKILLAILFLVAGISALYAQKYSGDSWAEIKKNGSGNLVCIYYETPGLVFKGDNGQMEGVCVDILKDFAAYIKSTYGKDVNIEFAGQEQVFTEFLKQTTQSPNVIGVANVSITPERKKIMQFSPSYMSNPMVLLTHKDAPSLTDLTEIGSTFKGFKARTISGSTHVGYIKSIQSKYFPGLEISYTTSGRIILQELTTQTDIFTILDFTEYFDAVKNRIPVKRHNVDLGEAEELGFIMGKTSDWKPLWDEFLTQEYRGSIAYRKIIANNLGNAFLSLIR